MADALFPPGSGGIFPLTAEEEPRWRTVPSLHSMHVERVWATLDAARAELAKLKSIFPPDARGQGIVGEGSWAVFAEKVVAERDEAQMRCRAATQRIVDTIGADGPTSLEDALTRLFAALDEAESLVDSHESVLRALSEAVHYDGPPHPQSRTAAALAAVLIVKKV